MNLKEFNLSNGVKIPSLGFGTYLIHKIVAADAVEKALKAGYRHIDTAAIYGNEKEVGEGVRNFGIEREKVFLTSKVWNSDRGYDKTLGAFEKTLKELKTNYLDLYLIHWPANINQFKNWAEINASTWKALEELYIDGKVRAIGVSNFEKKHLQILVENCKIMPMVNQIEVHAGHQNNETVEYAKSLGIQIEAWASLGQSRLINNITVSEVAEKYQKSAAQILLKWLLQKQILPLVKSINENRIIENYNIYDFELSAEDVEKINNIEPQGFSGLVPDEVSF